MIRAVIGSWRPVAFALVAFVAWWATTTTGLLPPYLVPSPGETWSAFADNLGYFASNTWVTVVETVIGFAIAVVVGEAVAVAMVYSPSLERTIYPVVLFAQVIPKIAIAPLFVVWLGFGMGPKIIVAVLMAFFPIVISGLAGLRDVDPEVLELTSTMGAGRARVFRKIRFPASLPQLFSGLKVAATLAVTGAVVGEFVGANSGLGYVILQANGNVDTASLFVALILMSIVGVLMFAAIQLVERLVIPWHASQRGLGSSTVQL
ncbi:ABC transporter permease [Terrabacter sp. NPDC000476]|uniref:ABC transporter permease n=1 Tax=Terrabacter sp. NPDC000476 TaxID=3154258 RepID=UPI003319FE6C